MEQLNIFNSKAFYKITKPIRLIELFAGYGSQAFALKYLGVPFEHYKICEWAIKSIQAYKDAHFTNDNVDYSKDLSVEEIYQYLSSVGVSQNYNEPLSSQQIKRLGGLKARQIYNNIQSTHNLVNIQTTHGEDLQIVDTDKYDYLLTYSYPCQDLSLAGKQAGMQKGSGTRSGLLWEVERILSEIYNNGGGLPQILLMENVPQVIGSKNKEYFNDWVNFLSSLGYTSKWQILNAKDFGIPQNRKRCFMISILGEFEYEFPEIQELKLKLKDLLETEVDESFYLTPKKIETIKNWKAQQNPFKDIDKEKECCQTLTARGAGEEHSGMVLINEDVYKASTKQKEVCEKALSMLKPNQAIDYTYSNSRLEEMNQGELSIKNAENADVAPTLTTNCNNYGYCVEDIPLKEKLCPTLDTRCDCLGVVVNDHPYTETEKQLFTKEGNVRRYINSEIVDEFKEGQMATTTYPNGYGHGSRTHNESISLNTIDKPSVKQNLRIRKLTPKECFRLMGVKDSDFQNIARNQSNASLYHLAGDSIVVNVLMAIIKNLI